MEDSKPVLVIKTEPINTSLKNVVDRLAFFNDAVRVVLEPGDATRYEFLIVPQQKGNQCLTFTGNTSEHFVVVRYTSGVLTACIIWLNGKIWPGNFLPISNNNEHTMEVFALWFEHLFDLIEECRSY